MKVETLKKVLDKIPDDYDVKYSDRSIKNSFKIDVDNQVLILE